MFVPRGSHVHPSWVTCSSLVGHMFVPRGSPSWVTCSSLVGHMFVPRGSLVHPSWVTCSSLVGHMFIPHGSHVRPSWVTCSSLMGHMFVRATFPSPICSTTLKTILETSKSCVMTTSCSPQGSSHTSNTCLHISVSSFFLLFQNSPGSVFGSLELINNWLMIGCSDH